jgi:transposase
MNLILIITIAKVRELGVSSRGAIVWTYQSGKNYGSVAKQYGRPKSAV